ncbi:MAG TPA: ATPase, T2SS/T4P/T4SS family [Candidatus Micrarchaeia archaeon]|nr:ATPase, T2SS/T4P/T4SS family [Candidatus Micrarchaeia archaeon]
MLAAVQSEITAALGRRAGTRLVAQDRSWIRELVDEQLRQYHSRAPLEGLPVLSRVEYRTLGRRVFARVTPLGPLGELLADPEVEEILVNGPKEVLVVRDGRQMAAGIEFDDEEQLVDLVQQHLDHGSTHFDRASPMVTATLEDGSRMNAVLPPVAAPLAITIRKHHLARFTTLDDLVAAGGMPWELMILLRAAVRGRLNIVISGGTGSGKTTLLRVLINEIPANERVITIEDQRELHVRTREGGRPNCISLEAREANVEGQGAITIQQLVRNALRQRPDRIFVGESRGPEALDVIDAMGTGHDGSGTTLHANSVRDTVHRLNTLIRRHPAQARADPAAIAHEVAAKVDLVIHLRRHRDPTGRDRRLVDQVALVTGAVECGWPVVEEVCRHDRGRGRWRWRRLRLDDLPAKVGDKLRTADVDLDALARHLSDPALAL